MSSIKLRLLQAVFSYFGRCGTSTRLRWGRVLGRLAPRLLKSRAHIVRTNLRLCFPEHDEDEREAWLQRHFRLLAQSVVDRGLLWFGSVADIDAAIDIQGMEHLERLVAAGRPVIMLAPHFIALDAAATRVTKSLKNATTLYTPQSDPDVDRVVREGRMRFNDVRLLSRRDGVRGLIRQLRQGVPVYYLPDMDFGRQGAIFVPFFGIPAATIPATAQIARAWNAAVVPIVSRLDETSGRYTVDVLAPLENFPGDDGPDQATQRINELIEQWVRRDPAQYYWVHRRFKTRPQPGEKKLY